MTLAALAQTLSATRSRLLDLRCDAGHWRGRLSGSALSTATAVCALAVIDATRHARLIDRGLTWLTENQNDDGGWGDTVRSKSNISTTVLCWSAFSAAGATVGRHENTLAAEAWLTRTAGGIDPPRLAEAVARRYGKDRTFSVPILTMCAIAGRLGPPRQAWRLVKPLPFELAVCPHRWFKWLRLPVVSYALPALIAMGQAHFHHRRPRNPIALLLRHLTRGRSLAVLRRIQPPGGGFLEAAPLTSFVVMSLASIGQSGHPVAAAGAEFLVRSARDDGSWPIDTDLATWVTTLAVNALDGGHLDAADRAAIRDWLLEQRHCVEHPYTHADPGGWAWSDLPGAVPDADDTPGALLALHHLGQTTPEVTTAATAGVKWLLDLQNRDGGIPTFCRGWGYLPFDRSGPDLTAHTLRAWSVWRGNLPQPLQRRIDAATGRALTYLARSRRGDGAWLPLWFGNQWVDDDANPVYGTTRVMTALAALDARRFPLAADLLHRASAWLISVGNADGGWGGGEAAPSSIEETALAVEALAAAHLRSPRDDLRDAMTAGIASLGRQTHAGTRFPPTPIGFYFAKLWYFEDLYPLIFTTAALTRASAALAGPDA